jgi:hypothetical protein
VQDLLMTAAEAIEFVATHGIVLASANGPVTNLVAAVTGEPIKGSWWAHPKGKQIFAVLQAVAASDQVLVCRLINGKVTFVHRRLWPALIRVAARFSAAQLALVQEQHTASGKHVTTEVPFPEWVPVSVAKQAQQLSEVVALKELADCGLQC